jgi:hypothetical protein
MTNFAKRHSLKAKERALAARNTSLPDAMQAWVEAQAEIGAQPRRLRPDMRKLTFAARLPISSLYD